MFNKSFFERNFGKIVIVIILLMSYIQLRYEYEEKVVTIARLKREINDIRYTGIATWGQLTTESRPENIIRKVEGSDVKLVESSEPPVNIK